VATGCSQDLGSPIVYEFNVQRMSGPGIKVKDGVFVGDESAAADKDFFIENKVTHCINCCVQTLHNLWEVALGVKYLNYRWFDSETQVLLDTKDKVIDEVFEFLEQALDQGGSVLIHSVHGQSRSCCLTTAYLMRRHGWRRDKAVEFLTSRVPDVEMKNAFMDQLLSYESRLMANSECELTRSWDRLPVVSPHGEGVLLRNTFLNVKLGCKEVSEVRARSSPSSKKLTWSDRGDGDKRRLESYSPAKLEVPQQVAQKNHSDQGKNFIVINTPSGIVQCSPNDIVPGRFGLRLKARVIVMEYSVPCRGIRAVHCIQVELHDEVLPSMREDADPDTLVVQNLQAQHALWLGPVSSEQLRALVRRIRCGATPRPRGQRVEGTPPTARASKRSKEADVRKVFELVGSTACESVSLNDILAFLCDYLGFGLWEAHSFFTHHAGGAGISFDDFQLGFFKLSPYLLGARNNEVFVRKPGSIAGQQVNLEYLEDCEVYVCDVTAQVFVDFCKRCTVLLGPCESSVYVRDCEDCIFWVAAQQLRTNNCTSCTFYLYSKTEPVIETSDDLAFAPWCARYPGCTGHFAKAGFDPQRNLWNAIFDFTGDTGCHWKIVSLTDVVELCVELDEPPEIAARPDNPAPKVTHEMLSAEPLSNGEGCGEGVANIPQTRPSAPLPPSGCSQSLLRTFRDEAQIDRVLGSRDLTAD